MPPKSIAPHERGDGAPVIDQFDHELREHVAPTDHAHWFAGRTSVRLDGDEFVVGVGSPFLLNWMQTSFHEAIRRTAVAVLGPAGRARFEVDPSLATTSESTEDRSSKPAGTARSVSSSAARKPANGRSSRTRRFKDLAEFVEGDCNRLAVVAAHRVSSRPAEGIGPLLLVGGVGTGKTHLLEGVHRRLRRDHPHLEVTSLNAETFGNYFVQALKDFTLPAFRKRFRDVDVLLVDDVDFFDGKKAMQEEFLNTVKHLERDGRQLVTAAGQHPRLMRRTTEELATRLASGVVCRLESPDALTRREIVDRKATRAGLRAVPEALDYVTKRFTGGVREIEGAVACLATWQGMTEKPITVPDARRVLAELARDCVRVVRMSDVERVVCEFFGVRSEDLRSKSRTRNVSRPRMVAMFLARKLMGAAYSEIGRHFARNHTTVLNAERKVNDWLSGHEPIAVGTERWTMDDVVHTLERELAG